MRRAIAAGVMGGLVLGGTAAMPALAAYAARLLKSDPVLLTLEHAHILLPQFHETAQVRGWQIDAVAILATHVQLVFGVAGDPDPSKMLGDWKSYGSRSLNRRFGKPAGEWWADKGSKRPLKTELRRWAANRYVRDQENPLLVWLSSEAQRLLASVPRP